MNSKETEIGGSAQKLTSQLKQLQLGQSRGEPMAAQGSSGVHPPVSPNPKPIKGILKNKDQRSPLAPGAFNYNGPVEELDVGVSLNNYEEDRRFTTLVDSKELYAKKVKAGLVKRRRNSSTESAPELSFRPKRDKDDEGDDGDDHTGGPPSYKPPLTV